MYIGKNIKNLREENGLTQKELADIAGVTDKAVSMWEQGKRDPRMGALQKIADYFDLRLSNLMGEENLNLNSRTDSLIIPVVDFIPLANSVIPEEKVLDYEAVPVSAVENGESYIFYKIPDNSMSQEFNKGDLAFVHLKNYIRSGSYGIFLVNGAGPFIRKLIFTGGRVDLVSENKIYPVQSFAEDEFKSVSVLGEIERLVRKY